MKKVVLIAAALMTAFAFTACDKDNNNGDDGGNNNQPFTGTTFSGKFKIIGYDLPTFGGNYVIKGDASNEIDEIRFIASTWQIDAIMTLVGKTSVSNGEFTVTLTAPPDDDFIKLNDAKDVFLDFYLSDTTAKITTFEGINIDGFKNGTKNEDVSLSIIPSDLSQNEMTFVYADKDVTFSGWEYLETGANEKEEYIAKYEMTLKKGWNVTERIRTENGNTITLKTVVRSNPNDWIWAIMYDINFGKSI